MAVTEHAIEHPRRTRHYESVFVYEWPVRVWHWINALCIVVLVVTGYYLGNPLLPSTSGEASEHFFIGYLRFAHFAAAYIFAVGFLGRLYWAFAGNRYAAHLVHLQIFTKAWWAGVWSHLKYYMFLERESERHVGSHPLDQLAVFLLFMVPTVILIFTGFALYGEGTGQGSWQDTLFGWVIPLLGGSQAVHLWHRLAMWAMLCYIIVHIYIVIREDIVSGQSYVGTMISGFRMFKD